MEPRKAESKKTLDQRKEVEKRRFQIVKLEWRIAPCNPHFGSLGPGHAPGGCF